MESAISSQDNSQELLSQLSPEILSLIAEAGLTPIPCRGKQQAGVEIDMPSPVGGKEIVWVGHYPGFSRGVDYQVALSTEASSIRWGVTREGALEFLRTGLIANGQPVARKGKDIKGLKQA